MDSPLNIDLNIPWDENSVTEVVFEQHDQHVEENEQHTQHVEQHTQHVEQHETKLDFHEHQPQKVDDTTISETESDSEENEPEGVIDSNGNVFLLYSM
jgi:glycogen synthase